MSDYRLGDETPPVQRSPRVYEEDGDFYFKTREGKAVGPYASQEEADQGLQDFIEFVQLAPLDALASLTDSLSDEDQQVAGGDDQDAVSKDAVSKDAVGKDAVSDDAQPPRSDTD